MAYAEMLLRDLSRLEDALKRMDVMPLGSGALAGTTYPLDRTITAKLLGFSQVSQNSLDGVSDRGLLRGDRLCHGPGDGAPVPVLRGAGAVVLLGVPVHRAGRRLLHRLQHYAQKKNPDIAELIRGKSGRVFGDVVALLTMMKGLPLAYNKDMQEDKEAVFDAVDTVKLCLTPLLPMVETMTVKEDKMRAAAAGGFINATDCADYLVAEKGLPFRDAYKITGELVALCIQKGLTLETLPLEEYQAICPAFDEGVYQAISLEKCVGGRKVLGGPAPENVTAQAQRVLSLLEQEGC